MTFIKDSNWNRIDKYTWTRFNIYHFDVNWINEFTGTKRDEEWYDKNGEDQYWHDRDYNKAKTNSNEKDETLKKFMEKKNILREKYLNMDFDFKFFEDDLKNNKPLIAYSIEKMWEQSYATGKFYYDNAWQLNSREGNMVLNSIINNTPPWIAEALMDPYFFFCTDDNFTYISNKNINVYNWDKIIMPFTAARAQALRYRNSWSNKHELVIKDWKLIYIKNLWWKREQTQYSINAREVRSIDQVMADRETKTDWKKTTWIWDISKLLEAEQNEIMASPVDWITLVSGVAWSGKTNVLLHRIQYLLWEQPGKKDWDNKRFSQNNMLFLCFNRALQKYIQTSIKNKFPTIQVKTIDQWCLDICKTYFPVNNIKLDEDTNFSIDEAKNIVNKYLLNLNDSNIWEFYVEKSWDSYEIKEWKTKKTQWSATVDINPNIINNLFPNFNYFTKKHLITWLYLVSITNLKQDSSNTFCLTIWNEKFRNLKTKWRTNANIDYSLNKAIYDHIFIDEVQDLSKAQIQIVNWFHNNSMTIAGDETQLIINWRIWDSLDKVFWIDIDYSYELRTSFRSSQQTSLFANEFLKNVKIKNSIKAISFKWLKPIVKRVQNLSEEYQYLHNKIFDLISNEPKASICVMYPKTDSSIDCANKLKSTWINCYLANWTTWNFSNAVHITNYFQAKWLEFDYVFICWINDFDGWNLENKNNIMFTLITRWIKRVYLLQRWWTPKLLNWIDPDTYILQ